MLILIKRKLKLAILISYKEEKGIFRDIDGPYTMINESVLWEHMLPIVHQKTWSKNW